MDFTILLIGLGIVVALFIIGKIFAILTKILVVILIVAALAVGFFIWQNKDNYLGKTGKTNSYIILVNDYASMPLCI